jgi:IclR family transcriptional regulator, acetate operon repressor
MLSDRGTPNAAVPVRSVERALDLLLLLERASEPVGVRELARLADMPRATVHRLLTVLETRGFVQSDRGRYAIGPGIVPLAGAFLAGDSLIRVALPMLERLTIVSGETSSLYIRQGFERVVVQRVDSPHVLRYTVRIGQRLPLHLGAAGHVLAAGLPEDELRQLLSQVDQVRLSNGQILTREELAERIARVRQQGFDISQEERELGVVAVAAPVVRPGRGTVAAIAVLGPPSRIPPDKAEQISLEVRRAAKEISESYRHL